MKLVTFRTAGTSRVGALLPDGKRLADLARAHELRTGTSHPALDTMQGLIEGGESVLDLARHALEWVADQEPAAAVHSFADVTLRSPVPVPVKLRCFSVYEKHMRQAFDAAVELRAGKLVRAANARLGLFGVPKGFYRHPIYYKGNHTAVVGHDEDVRWPAGSAMLDYELELGVFLWKGGMNLREKDGLDHVFGYACFDDFSARDVLMKEILGGVGPLKGKDFQTGNAIGPWIVTRDEIPDPHALRMEVRVNGEVRGVASTADMHHSIGRMIERASENERLVPGEFFGTGAAGDGCGIEHLRFLAPGDVVEIDIERIGVLRNRVLKPVEENRE